LVRSGKSSRSQTKGEEHMKLLFILFITIVFFVLGMIYERGNIIYECNHFKVFRDGEKLYDCTRRIKLPQSQS
jgi:hypothetical protein